MQIQLDNIGKKFGKEWIFKSISINLSTPNKYVVLGGNGSGKSTFLKLLSGFMTPSDGSVSFQENENNIDIADVFKKVTYSAPYIDVYEHYTLQELFDFQKKLKPFLSFEEELSDLFQLTGVKNKLIKNYSSGMKQRVKLGLAILADAPLLLLDEPTSNLDEKGKKWYAEMIEKFAVNKLVIVASNSQKEEYFFCKNEIKIEDFK